MTNMITLVTYALFFLYLVTTIASAYPNCDQLPPHGIGPLFTFGHTILPKKHWALSEEILYAKTKPYPTILSLSQFFYGINDSLTISGNIPVVHQKSLTNTRAGGLGDCYCNLNMRLLNNKTETHDYRIIGVAGVRIPTTTGVFGESIYTYNTTSFFLGANCDALTRDWYLYYDFGTLFFTKRSCRQFGHLINFNAGIGRSLCFNGNYLSLFIELSDYYSKPDRINNVPLLNTGGNILLIGPTLRYAHKSGFLAQAGIQLNVSEHLRNRLDTIGYVAGGYIAYTY